MTRKKDPEYSPEELVALIKDARILGVDRADDPAQLERVGQILDHLDVELREDVVQRIASEDSIARTKIRRLARKYSLTPAECKLVESLCAGSSMAEHAKEHGISPNTARTHMQRVREKLGVKRQADIVRLALK
ncbi:MAG: hypothetical protein Cons2KO_12870 [Congregibacter sp.]